jgi:nicotinamidase-related amidase
MVAGIQSEHCVAATCRAALALGYDVQLAEDGHSTWPENDRSAEEIIASQNQDLRSRGVALHRTAELIAAIVEDPSPPPTG